MDRENEALRQAADLIRAGRPQEALPRLLAMVKTHPQAEQAWFLLSFALTEPQQQRDCLQRVLKINPAHAEAQAKLGQIASPGPAQTPRPASPPKPPAKISPFTTLADEDLSGAPAFEPDLSLPTGPPPAMAPAPSFSPPPALNWDRAPSPPAAPQAAAAPPPGGLSSTPAAIRPPATPAQTSTGKPKPAPLSRSVPLLVGGIICLSALGLLVAAFFAFQVYQANRIVVPTAVLSNASTPPPLPSATVAAQSTTPEVPASPTPALTPSPSPTRAPTKAPTPNATVQAAMDVIQQQVADLRGLASEGQPPRYLISKYRLETTARGLLINADYVERLKNTAQVYTALGLIKPTYDLVKFALNSQVDSIGGFYVPWTKEIFVVGEKFSGIQHYVFSHEYNHALIDQHFHIDELGVYPYCQGDQQRCEALRALVEGDATLLMDQWWRQYATPQDYQDIQSYTPPAQALPEQYPPPFAGRANAFPYEAGLAFVKHLHTQGNWAEVNRAYANLPQSTEQILHPAKYLAGEAPLSLAAPPLAEALGADWQLVDTNVLGEWMTYLVLGYGADVASQIDEETARTAAAGWGGDRYQVYYSLALTQTVLAAQWTWDTPADTKEFRAAMQFYLNARYRGAKLTDRTDGDCWEANHQAACLFAKGQSLLWLVAPDQTTLNTVLAQYPDFP